MLFFREDFQAAIFRRSSTMVSLAVMRAMAFCGELVAMSGWNFADKTMGAQQSKLSGDRRASAALKFWFSG